MPEMIIKMDATRLLEGRDIKETVNIETPVTCAALPHGMASGAPSVAIIADLPDGRAVVIQTSLRNFLTCAVAFRAKYGDLS